MMPLYPPALPVEHPADLVIDVFGTFLGKKSERMVIRWREIESSTDIAAEVSPDAGEQSKDLEHHSIPQTDAFAHAETSALEAVPGSTSKTDYESGASSPLEGSNLTQKNHPADEVASRLLQLWGRQHPAPEVSVPTPLTRLHDQLEDLAEPSTDQRPSGAGMNNWQERAVPMSRLRSVTISGRGITLSSDLISSLVERGISLSFLSGRGQPVAQLSAPGLGGTVQTRRSQLAAYETSLGVDLAVEFIRGKLRNQKHQLQYSGKYLKAVDLPRYERLIKKIKAMATLRKQLADFKADRLAVVRDKLMGYEGTGARIYWEGVAIILEGRIDFPGRLTRGAVDSVNSALNYGYGILYGQVAGAVVNAGLELYAGYLHVDRPGKPALVLDLVEEFRAPIVDRSILALVNQGVTLETDPHGLTAATKKLVAHRVLERLSTSVPYEGKRWPLGTIIQNQARHLAVAVRGEREYRAFASRW